VCYAVIIYRVHANQRALNRFRQTQKKVRPIGAMMTKWMHFAARRRTKPTDEQQRCGDVVGTAAAGVECTQ